MRQIVNLRSPKVYFLPVGAQGSSGTVPLWTQALSCSYWKDPPGSRGSIENDTFLKTNYEGTWIALSWACFAVVAALIWFASCWFIIRLRVNRS